jgi:hypothetical protein
MTGFCIRAAGRTGGEQTCATLGLSNYPNRLEADLGNLQFAEHPLVGWRVTASNRSQELEETILYFEIEQLDSVLRQVVIGKLPQFLGRQIKPVPVRPPGDDS